MLFAASPETLKQHGSKSTLPARKYFLLLLPCRLLPQNQRQSGLAGKQAEFRARGLPKSAELSQKKWKKYDLNLAKNGLKRGIWLKEA
jgi:hypothetical protein